MAKTDHHEYTREDQILQRAQEAKERKLLDELAQSDEGLASLLKELDELQAS